MKLHPKSERSTAQLTVVNVLGLASVSAIASLCAMFEKVLPLETS